MTINHSYMKEYLTADIVKSSLANLQKLTFEVTDACNLQCKYCGYGLMYDNYDKRENKRLSLTTAIKLFDYLSNMWNSDYNLSLNRTIHIGFYGGEPLLNMDFVKKKVDYIERNKSSNLLFQYSMTTNAILLEKYMDYLAKMNFQLLISLDGNEENNSYRVDKMGREVYQKVINSINQLKIRHPQYYSQYVNFNAVLHNRNSVKDIYTFFKRTFGKTPSIGELNLVGIKKNKKEEFQKMRNDFYRSFQHYNISMNDIGNEIYNLPGFKEVVEYIFEYSGFVYDDYYELYFGKEQRTIPTGTHAYRLVKDCLLTLMVKFFLVNI